MRPDRERLNYLFHRYLHNNASWEELEELFVCIKEAGKDALLKEQIMEVFQQAGNTEDIDPVNWDEMFSRIVDKPDKEPKENEFRIRKFPVRWRVAATILILILGGAGAYLYFNNNIYTNNIARSQFQYHKNDILPGGNKAVLTLSNGAKVILDSAQNGKLVSQGNVNVLKVDSGMLVYTPSIASRQKVKIKYNTLATPRGGQYQLTLSDGTKVWLNAASSIRFPTAFFGKERKVEITGEAYFEVAHNAKMPFRVKAGKELIKVIGTHFNVNAYADEPVLKTTLLEGSVKIALASPKEDGVARKGSPQGVLQTFGEVRLQPGEQAVLKKNGQIAVVKPVNMEDAVAWKNGFFAFSNDNLQTVMRKLSRWYDVTVIYQAGANNKQHFSGRIDRSLTLSQVLSGLAQTKAHFRIEANRKVVILP